MIDNIDKVREMLSFEKKGWFYFIQVIKRRKDIPDLPRDMKRISEYYIYSLKEFDEAVPKIKEEADFNNARVYIHLRPRSAQKVALKALLLIGEYIDSEQPEASHKAYTSACGKTPVKKVKSFLIDFDFEGNPYKLGNVCFWLTNTGVCYKVLSTYRGRHIICTPFRLDKFNEAFPGIDVHKDSPTLLYKPNTNESRTETVRTTCGPICD
jgi:hypothetical protein